ncbi:unnamed protein product [Camellia sinensis]
MSSTACNGRAHIARPDPTTSFPPPLRRSSRRTPPPASSPTPFSSYSSLRLPSSQNDETNPFFSPNSPLPSSGIPFSWEKLPGIPKKQHSKKNDVVVPSLHLLPLPPSRKLSLQKKHAGERERDPFLAALVECSKEDHDHQHPVDNLWEDSRKVSRNLSDRFGFIVSINGSCRRTCSVSESIVRVPRRRTYGRSG